MREGKVFYWKTIEREVIWTDFEYVNSPRWRWGWGEEIRGPDVLLPDAITQQRQGLVVASHFTGQKTEAPGGEAVYVVTSVVKTGSDPGLADSLTWDVV